MTKKIKKLMASLQARDKKGRWIKETKIQKSNRIRKAITILSDEGLAKNQDEIKRLEKIQHKKPILIEEEEGYEEWEYFVGLDYDSDRGSNHDFKIEIKVKSDRELSVQELADLIIESSDNFQGGSCTSVIASGKFTIKTKEKNMVRNVPSNKVTFGKISR